MRTRMMSTLVLASATGLLTSGLHADVLEVAADGSRDYVSIQSAVDAAATGDTILVYPGSYSETVSETDGKSLQIRSSRGPAVTVISGASAPEARVVTLSGDGTGQFRGFTVRDGHGISSSGYAISACIVESNGLTGSMSAAIDLGAGSSLSGCVVRDNVSATTATCAGAYLGADGISVTSCLFDRNEAAPGAGAHAVYANGSLGGVVSGCVLREHGVSGNVTLYVDGGSLEVRECTFCLNWIDTNGDWTDGGGNTFASSCPPFNDCDLDGVPDEIQLAMGDYADCNENGVVDACDLADGTLNDADGDGVPDECAGVTWTVDDDGPADFATIQEAIDASGPGDTILVLPGTYTPRFFNGGFVGPVVEYSEEGSLRIESRDGPDVTILDGIASSPTTLYTVVNSGSLAGSLQLRGFAILPGYYGSISAYASQGADFALVIDQCSIRGTMNVQGDFGSNLDVSVLGSSLRSGILNCYGFGYGGPAAAAIDLLVDDCSLIGFSIGMYSYGLVGFDSIVRDSAFSDVDESAIRFGQSPWKYVVGGSTQLTIESCSFDGCSSFSNGDGVGGAIDLSPVDGTFTVRSCSFDGCAADYGGGISFTRDSPEFMPGSLEVVDCDFVNCYAAGSGGAMYLYNTSGWAPILRDCDFTECIAEDGGAVAAANADLVVEGGSFLGNVGDSADGADGISMVLGTLDMTGTSFVAGSFSDGSLIRLVLSDSVIRSLSLTSDTDRAGIEQLNSTLLLQDSLLRSDSFCCLPLVLNKYSSELQIQDNLFCASDEDWIRDDATSSTIDLGGNVFDDDCSFNTPGDLNGDGCVDGEDLLLILAFYNEPSGSCPSCDLDGDGLIDGADLTVVLGAWTGCQ